MMSNHDDIFNRITMILEEGDGPDLSDDQVDYINSLPLNYASESLINTLGTSPDPYVRSRSFDGLMRLNGFDHVGFLCLSIETSDDVDWRIVYAESLGEFADQRVTPALCRVLKSDEDDDVRFIAAEQLEKVGAASALPILDYAVAHDLGTDYEGRTVAGAAWKAAQRICGEPGMRRPVEEWMAELPPLSLREIVRSLDSLGNHLAIFSTCREPLSAMSLMQLVPPTEYLDVLYDEYDLEYFLEIVLVKQILMEWSKERDGRSPTVDEACEALLDHVSEQRAAVAADIAEAQRNTDE